MKAEEEEEQEVRLELEEREREARRAEEQLISWQQNFGRQQLDVEGSEKGETGFQANIDYSCMQSDTDSCHTPVGLGKC